MNVIQLSIETSHLAQGMVVPAPRCRKITFHIIYQIEQGITLTSIEPQPLALALPFFISTNMVSGNVHQKCRVVRRMTSNHHVVHGPSVPHLSYLDNEEGLSPRKLWEGNVN